LLPSSQNKKATNRCGWWLLLLLKILFAYAPACCSKVIRMMLMRMEIPNAQTCGIAAFEMWRVSENSMALNHHYQRRSLQVKPIIAVLW
jgi:hypothetical protein